MRDDRSLGYQLTTEGVAHVLALDDANKYRQRKENRGALAWKPSGLASCYSYGALMQTAEATPRYDACFKRTFQMF
jgi:nitric-oxide synthase